MALFSMLQGAGVSDFETLLDRAPTFLKHIQDEIIKGASRLGMQTQVFEGQSVVFVGWSERAGRMIGRAFEQESRAASFALEDVNPYYSAPWDQSLAKLPDPK